MQLDTERLKLRLQDHISSGDRRKAEIQEEMARLEQKRDELLEAIRRVESVETLAERFGEEGAEGKEPTSDSGEQPGIDVTPEGEFAHTGVQSGFEPSSGEVNPSDSGGDFDRWG